MPQLISEDEEIKSSFSLMLLPDKADEKMSISWVPYKIILNSGDKKLIYEKQTISGTGDYVLAITPVNEVEGIICGILDFLDDKTKNMFSFEPIEPSFELILERSHGGYSVICWIDSGNVDSTHYAWDGFGIRFFTNEKNIRSFVDELKRENKVLIK